MIETLPHANTACEYKGDVPTSRGLAPACSIAQDGCGVALIPSLRCYDHPQHPPHPRARTHSGGAAPGGCHGAARSSGCGSASAPWAWLKQRSFCAAPRPPWGVCTGWEGRKKMKRERGEKKKGGEKGKIKTIRCLEGEGMGVRALRGHRMHRRTAKR